MPAPLLVAGGLAAGGLVASKFLGKKKTTTQVPLEPPEITAARNMLLDFASTGKFGKFEAGAEVPLKHGDYRMTDIEGQGLSDLEKLLATGIPEEYRLSDQAIGDLMDTSEAGLDRMFQPFKALTDRQVRESETALKRNAGAFGNLYSTDTVRKLGDVQARGNETMTAELARLSEGALNRKLSAIPLALQSAQSKEDTVLNRIGASQHFGALTRQLNDASIKARDAELLRRRAELQLPIQAAQTVSGQQVNYGVPSVTTSPYQELLGMVGKIGGNAAGSYVSGRAFSAGAGR